VREIQHKQLKSGVLFANQAEEQIDKPDQTTFDLVQHVKKLGITDGLWMYYFCWGGELESVATARVVNSVIDMNSYSLSESMSYIDLFSLFKKFDIKIERSGHFEPFVRNYWGEYGY